jgi:hypothetical protein
VNRYPDAQARQDEEDMRLYGRLSKIRPGAKVVVKVMNLAEETSSVISSRVSDMDPKDGDAVLVATRAYGRRWFHTHGHPFRVIEEIGQ